MSAEVIERAPLVLQHDGARAERHQQPQSTAIAPSASMFVGLTLVEREFAVTSLVERASVALREAAQAGEPADVMAAYKDQAAAIADLSKRIDVSKDAVLDAQVLQRRAERGLGVAIRQGQEAGTVADTGSVGGNRSESRSCYEQNLLKPSDLATSAELSGNGAGIYALADNGTDDDFEIAVSEAREEGNVSRANVVRKLKEQVERSAIEQAGSEARRADMQSWHEQLAQKYPTPRLAFEAEGHARHATLESFKNAAVSRYGAEYRFTEPAYAKHSRTSQQWLENASESIEVSLDVFSNIDWETITPEQADAALQRINVSEFNFFIKTLKGIANG